MGVLIDLEESWSVVLDREGPLQFWSCSKQSWCYGDSLRLFFFHLKTILKRSQLHLAYSYSYLILVSIIKLIQAFDVGFLFSIGSC